MRNYGPRQRTHRDRVGDAIAFIHGAWPHMLLSMTAEKLCERCGVTTAADRKRVEAALVVAQTKERGRDAG